MKLYCFILAIFWLQTTIIAQSSAFQLDSIQFWRFATDTPLRDSSYVYTDAFYYDNQGRLIDEQIKSRGFRNTYTYWKKSELLDTSTTYKCGACEVIDPVWVPNKRTFLPPTYQDDKADIYNVDLYRDHDWQPSRRYTYEFADTGYTIIYKNAINNTDEFYYYNEHHLQTSRENVFSRNVISYTNRDGLHFKATDSSFNKENNQLIRYIHWYYDDINRLSTKINIEMNSQDLLDTLALFHYEYLKDTDLITSQKVSFFAEGLAPIYSETVTEYDEHNKITERYTIDEDGNKSSPDIFINENGLNTQRFYYKKDKLVKDSRLTYNADDLVSEVWRTHYFDEAPTPVTIYEKYFYSRRDSSYLIDERPSLTVYPNPTTDYVLLKGDLSEVHSYAWYLLDGKRIGYGVFQENRLDLPDRRSPINVLMLFDKNRNRLKRVLVIAVE